MGTSGEKLARRLMEMKEQLENEKARRSELQGELRSVMKQLKQEYSVDTLEEAEELLEETRQRVEAIEADLLKKVEEAEALLDGD